MNCGKTSMEIQKTDFCTLSETIVTAIDEFDATCEQFCSEGYFCSQDFLRSGKRRVTVESGCQNDGFYYNVSYNLKCPGKKITVASKAHIALFVAIKTK